MLLETKERRMKRTTLALAAISFFGGFSALIAIQEGG